MIRIFKNDAGMMKYMYEKEWMGTINNQMSKLKLPDSRRKHETIF